MGRRNADRPGFGTFVAPPASKVEILDRSRYAGLTPATAATLLVADYVGKKPLEPSTQENKTVVYRKVLTDIAQRGLDLATVDTAALTEYRAYLRDLVDQKAISENYAYNIVKDWNAMVNLLFGERDLRPGEGLKMKGFRQHAKEGDHLTIEEMELMLAQLPNRKFRSDHYRQATRVFLELAMASAGRWDSIGAPQTTFACVDWSKRTIKFPKVKNRDTHEALLTDRAMACLKEQRRFLIEKSTWYGEDKTSLLTGPDGRTVTYNTVNVALHDLAELALIKKRVTTHVPRKSVGTHMARDNPRLAREQLGITAKIFDKHYNQPRLEDRLERRDLLPGASPHTRSPAERIGELYMQLASGRISKDEFDLELSRGLLAEAVKPKSKDQDAAYG